MTHECPGRKRKKSGLGRIDLSMATMVTVVHSVLMTVMVPVPGTG